MTHLQKLCKLIKLDAIAYQHFTKADTRLVNQIHAIGRTMNDEERILDMAEVCNFKMIQAFLQQARQAIHPVRLMKEKSLAHMVHGLPIWPWVEKIRGFGPLNLAQIVAETTTLWPNGRVTTLSDYDRCSKVYKRLGVGLVDGQIQRRISTRGVVGAEKMGRLLLIKAHGYDSKRRAIVHNLGETLLKGNKAPDGTPGYYYGLYLYRKTVEQAKDPKQRPAAWHWRSLRYIEKQALKHLWQQWKACERVESITHPSAVVPDGLKQIVA